ncbi:MAG: hypothetical protein JSU00_27100 [Acidobacteria bacterium]|nr:hypothetical protein [Acidobacteriota bacterium]
MGLGDLTRQFAQEAIKSSTKDMLDSLRPPELAGIADALAGNKPSAPPAISDNVGATILGQIQAMQKALKEEDELVLLCESGVETLRILEIFLPSWRVAVLTGIDAEKTVTRVVCPVDHLRLVCKVMRAPANVKPARVRIIAPKV